jgi:periplasmic copper chaperone A
MRYAASLLALLLLAAAPASAADAKLGDLTVADPWARATPGAAKTGAAYLTVRNAGAQADRIVSAAASGTAARAELHTHLHENGVMKMRHVDAVEVPAGGEAVFVPGQLHIMLMGLEKALKPGDSFELTLTFEKAGAVTVTVPVLTVGAMGPGARGTGAHSTGAHGTGAHGTGMTTGHGAHGKTK